MSSIPTQVAEALAAHGLEALEFEPGSTPTAPTAAARIGVEVGQIAKSILLKAKNGCFYLVVAAGDRRIDNKKFKQQVGFKARMAKADETEEVTGFRPGGVCPFGLECREGALEILIDHSLDRYETIYPAAGTDASGVPMSVTQLCEVTSAGRCDVMAE